MIKKDLDPLTGPERKEVQRSIKEGLVVSSRLADKLLNDLEREELRSGIYYSGLGPSDGDFSHDADRRCYSKRVLRELGLE